MPELPAGLVPVLMLVLAAEFVNGWTDAPNAIATVVSTRVLTPTQALVVASVLNVLGVLSGQAVAATIGRGIVDAAVIDTVTVASAMVAIVVWSTLAWTRGLPTSESHALLASLAGAGMATAGPGVLLWEGWRKVLVGLAFSTLLGFGAGSVLMLGIAWGFRRMPLAAVRRLFGRLQVLSAAFMAFSHGSPSPCAPSWRRSSPGSCGPPCRPAQGRGVVRWRAGCRREGWCGDRRCSGCADQPREDAMGKPAHVNEQDFEAQVVRSDLPVVVDFWAEWCAPCRMIAPIIEDLAVEYAGRVKVVKVDVDANPHIAHRYGIMSIPTLGVFKGGEMVDRVVGYMPKPELKRRLEKILGATVR